MGATKTEILKKFDADLARKLYRWITMDKPKDSKEPKTSMKTRNESKKSNHF